MAEKIDNILSEENLLELAKTSGFIKRESKLKAHSFLDMLLFKNVEDDKFSLLNMVSSLTHRYQQHLSKQSIHERFTQSAVNFIKSVIKQYLEAQLSSTRFNESCYFKAIKIKDSTRFQLPAHLKNTYPGCGGNASESGCHIQLEYDALNHHINDLKLTDALTQDSTDAKETIHTIHKDELIIRDLGYYSQKVLLSIMEQSAYFLSRVKPKTCFYYVDQPSKKVDFVALKKQMKSKGIKQMELLVHTTLIKKPIRLIIDDLPEQVIEQRISKAKKEAKKKGRTLSKEYKVYASLNLFITNAPKEKLSIQSSLKLYHLRWQIELRFKVWKSIYSLDRVKKVNRYRFECQLYAKFLYLLISWEIGNKFQMILWKSHKALASFYKVSDMINQHCSSLRNAFQGRGESIILLIEEWYLLTRKSLLQEKRKDRVNLEDLLYLVSDIQ